MKNKKLVILLAIVLVIILGVAIYFAIPKNNNNAQKEEQKLEQEQVIEEGQKQYSQINLENTENAKVEDGKKINTSEKLLQNKTIDGINIKDIKLVAENGTTTLTATVENKSQKKINAGKITINFTNSNGEIYAKLNSYIGDIDIGKTGNLNASTTRDLANAYDFTINFN